MIINITEIGAKPDGITFCEGAIQKAIDMCHEKGGGRVVVPAGVYLSRPIELKSNVTLYLEEGAILKASPYIEDYFKIGYYHNEWGDVTSFLFAMNQKNISIEGKGTIDLSGNIFMDFSQAFNIFDELQNLTPEQFEETECKPKYRPNQPIFFYNCENINLSGISIIDSPCWTVCIHSSKFIQINSIKIVNNLRVPNSDGIHLCSCENGIITNNFFVCGDDCVALSSITNWEKPCKNVIGSNCIRQTRSAALRMGHLDSKIKKGIASNLIVQNSNRGIAIFANGKNGYVKHVIISNVTMSTKIFAGTWWGKGEPIVIAAPEEGNLIEDITISNVKAFSENGIVIYGKNKNIKNVTLKDIDIYLSFGKNRPQFAKKIDLLPSECPDFPEYMRKIPWIFAKDTVNLKLLNINYGYGSSSSNKDYDIEGLFKNLTNCLFSNVAKSEKFMV